MKNQNGVVDVLDKEMKRAIVDVLDTKMKGSVCDRIFAAYMETFYLEGVMAVAKNNHHDSSNQFGQMYQAESPFGGTFEVRIWGHIDGDFSIKVINRDFPLDESDTPEVIDLTALHMECVDDEVLGFNGHVKFMWGKEYKRRHLTTDDVEFMFAMNQLAYYISAAFEAGPVKPNKVVTE